MGRKKEREQMLQRINKKGNLGIQSKVRREKTTPKEKRSWNLTLREMSNQKGPFMAMGHQGEDRSERHFHPWKGKNDGYASWENRKQQRYAREKKKKRQRQTPQRG